MLGGLLAVIGAYIAWHHPLGGALASIIFFLLVGLGLARFPYWLVLIPSTLPIIDLAPWSGWVTFEEFDLLVLALASGAYLRVGFLTKDQPLKNSSVRVPLSAVVLIAGFSLSIAVSMVRGFDDAGGYRFGWYQGYYESMNSIRLAKSFFLALCLMPLWLRSYRGDPGRTISILGWGMGAGLGLVSLATIWERLAFTDLLNFSADYRTTALFWEMHVGGAALDGFLALTVPFALWNFVRARSLRNQAYVYIVLAMAVYACVTTFSRGVYLAIPIGLAIFAALSAVNRRSRESGRFWSGENLTVFFIVCLFGGAAYWIFPTSGYRGMFALCIAVVLWYPVSHAWGQIQLKRAWLAFVVGAFIAVLGTVVGYFLPKGAYLLFSTGVMLTVAALMLERGGISFRHLVMVAGGYLLTLAGCVSIALHWGGVPAFESMSMVCLALFFSMIAARPQSLPARSGRWQIGLLATLLIVGFSVATFSGGSYMTERFSSSEHDLKTRFLHWEGGLAQMNSIDWMLGKGTGRYPASNFFAMSGNEHPGGYRHVEDEKGGYLLLSGGQHIIGWGEMFRVTQRISTGFAPYSVEFEVRADKDVQLHFEVCEKHLLYSAACVLTQVGVKGAPDQWHKLKANLVGSAPSRGVWYAPKLIGFSVAMETRGGVANLDNLTLRNGLGESLLANGDFSNGLAHWFSSSDAHHMPWHIKSLFLHILFEQGGLGMGIFLLLVLGAFWRLTAGSARQHPLAPPLVGSLAGFLVVGLFDSLLDVPRLAMLFYLLLMISMTIHVKTEGRLTTSET